MSGSLGDSPRFTPILTLGMRISRALTNERRALQSRRGFAAAHAHDPIPGLAKTFGYDDGMGTEALAMVAPDGTCRGTTWRDAPSA